MQEAAYNISVSVEFRRVHLRRRATVVGTHDIEDESVLVDTRAAAVGSRSEERRVGKECRSRWGVYQYKKKLSVHAIDERNPKGRARPARGVVCAGAWGGQSAHV